MIFVRFCKTPTIDIQVCSLAFSGEFITNTNEDCHHVVFVWQLTRETCTQALDICSAYRSSLEPGLLESELRSQDNHCIESLQPLLYVALARQTCRASSDEGSHQDQAKHDALFILP